MDLSAADLNTPSLDADTSIVAYIINSTTLNSLSAARKATLKQYCEDQGPQTIGGDAFPKNPDGSFKTDLTSAEVLDVVDKITREDWERRVHHWELDQVRVQTPPEDPFTEGA